VARESSDSHSAATAAELQRSVIEGEAMESAELHRWVSDYSCQFDPLAELSRVELYQLRESGVPQILLTPTVSPNHADNPNGGSARS
jgi:hypothetical protein